MSSEPGLIALDWGTSALRAYLLDRGGAVLGSRSAALGIMQVADGDFAAAFAEVAGDWRARWPALRAVAAGMVGSAQGWVEAPYLDCPAGPEDLAGALAPVPGGTLLVIPGVAQRGAAPDVMRGEETQVAGALALRPALRTRCRLLLPGTHSKWVEVTDGRIARFRTFMTGELFGVLRAHSILGRFAAGHAPPGEPEGRDAFARGVGAAREGASGLAPLLFSARALVLTGGLRPEDSLDYLSGLLIGDELRCALPDGPREAIALIGEPDLCRRYRDALALFGVADAGLIENATPAGLWRVAAQAGLTAAAHTEPAA